MVRCFARGSGEGSGSGSGNKVLEKKVCGRRQVAGKVAGRGGFLEGKVPDKVPENIGKGSERGVGSLVPPCFGRLCFHVCLVCRQQIFLRVTCSMTFTFRLN